MLMDSFHLVQKLDAAFVEYPKARMQYLEKEVAFEKERRQAVE